MKNQFLSIKLISLDASGMAIAPPCDIPFSVCIHLTAFIATTRFSNPDDGQTVQLTVRETLEQMQNVFPGCALGWKYDDGAFETREQMFSFRHNKTEINLNLEPIKKVVKFPFLNAINN